MLSLLVNGAPPELDFYHAADNFFLGSFFRDLLRLLLEKFRLFPRFLRLFDVVFFDGSSAVKYFLLLRLFSNFYVFGLRNSDLLILFDDLFRKRAV